ncbi:MFS transporter [Desulfosarcina widdelii]|uniref:MFS transporter n=1 Tax=Desulfosarcina widdelii TaxID=947919 RepID=A0A5K7YX85_9BACT|nr:MFS transporter [Desulfosarcina widdelii]BBO73228.1 MFS transporter [Desulfosarcina widdelii]
MTKDPITAERHSFAALLTVCCLVTFGCYFAISMRLPVVPLYAAGFGVSTSEIGMINAAFYLMAGMLALPSGIMSDSLGRRRLAVYGTIVLFTGMLLLYFSRSFLYLAGIYLLLGIGIAAFGPTMMSWVSEISPSTHMGRAYGWYTTALFCGLGMGPAAGGALGEWLGFRPVFLIGAALVAITIWAVQWFLPALEAPADLKIEKPRQQLNWRLMLTNRQLMGCWLVTFGANIIGGAFFTFLPLLAYERGLDVGQIGIVYLVQSITNALARIPFGTISDRIGRRKYQALLGVVLASLSIAGFAPAVTFVHFLLAAFCLGVSLAIAFTSIGALIAETTEPRFRGLAMGGYNSFIYFGLMAGSIGLGPLIEAIGFGAGFLFAGASNLFFVSFFAWSMLGYSQDNRNTSES